ncbi:hypothetical protein FRB91_008528 [Serendipita sp. 411]|nr:hypothetical protein FRB91_008528 [Serendipita sp. 411]
MRNATVLVIRLRGVATEAIKNIVLAGIGKLIVIDDTTVQPEDINAGFFFREEDIDTKKRVDAAKPHIQSLNPLVIVEVSHDLSVLTNEDTLLKLIQGVDLVCLTDTDQATATIEYFSPTAALEWSPSCAVLGGMLGQDILKALAAREPPMANFFFFDGQTCNGTVVRMSMDTSPSKTPAASLGVAAEATVLEID